MQDWRVDHGDSRPFEIVHGWYRDLKVVDDLDRGHHGGRGDGRVQLTYSNLGKDVGLKARWAFEGSNMTGSRSKSVSGRCVQMSLAAVLCGLSAGAGSDACPWDQMVVRHSPVDQPVHRDWAAGSVLMHLMLAHAVPLLCLGLYGEAVNLAVRLCSVCANGDLANC